MCIQKHLCLLGIWKGDILFILSLSFCQAMVITCFTGCICSAASGHPGVLSLEWWGGVFHPVGTQSVPPLPVVPEATTNVAYAKKCPSVYIMASSHSF